MRWLIWSEPCTKIRISQEQNYWAVSYYDCMVKTPLSQLASPEVSVILKKNEVSLSEGITNLNHRLSNISNNNLYPSNCNEEQWVCNGINDSKFILIECKRALKKCIIVSRLRTIYTYKVTFSFSPSNTFLGSDVKAGFLNSVLKFKKLICLYDKLKNELL